MTIIRKTFDVAGQIGAHPRRIKLVVTDNLATVTTAGYLNNQNLQPDAVYPTDIFDIVYSFVKATATGTYGEFLATITSGVITLSLNVDAGNVLLPVVANHIAQFNGTSGQIYDGSAPAVHGGNIQAGLSGTAGTLASFPGVAAKGSLVIAAVANTGNTLTTISNDAMGQASVINIPDPANAIGQLLIGATATPLVSGNFPQNSGTAGLVVDSGLAVSNIVSKAAANTFTGVGSIILPKVNGTEVGNAVTASGVAGLITTSALTTAGGATYVITWTNTKISTTSIIGLTIQGGSNNATNNITFTCAAGASSATLTIYNNTAATSLNGTLIIGYSVL